MYTICKIKNISGEYKELCGKGFDANDIYEIPEERRLTWAENDDVYSSIINEEFIILDSNDEALTSINDQITLLRNELTKKVITTPFSDKTGYNFAGLGASFTIAANTTSDLEVTLPTGTYDFDGVSLTTFPIIYGDLGTMKVKDDSNGTYSGYPNYVLNQFATNWNIDPNKCEKMMPYPARVYTGMKLCITYTNNSDTEKNIYMNISLHKVLNT